ncbi:hypothetical protein PIROE2DRAFT_4630 [Piromyces sp. E2]|nr:hypothetical protein PIROE2DRAFT_4630 [Piromyces sp. E2]|eukprot:OUM67820.1 hypothetical protein PIROE2DRAFT_4630 [Piromyces sp. E2]
MIITYKANMKWLVSLTIACGPNRTLKTSDPLNGHQRLIIILKSSISVLRRKIVKEKCPIKLNASDKVRWYD